MIFIALLKTATNIPCNSYHLITCDMSWVRVELHQNCCTSVSRCEHPGIDYSVVFCPAREKKKWDKRAWWLSWQCPIDYQDATTLPNVSFCLISLWPALSLPIWLTWNWLILSFMKDVLSNYYVLGIHLGTRNSDKKPCLHGAYILVEKIHYK